MSARTVRVVMRDLHPGGQYVKTTVDVLHGEAMLCTNPVSVNEDHLCAAYCDWCHALKLRIQTRVGPT